MKAIFLIGFVCTCAVTQLYSQTSTKTFSFGGLISFTTNEVENPPNDSKVTSIAFSPTVGYFIKDKMEIGINMNFLRESTEAEYAPAEFTETEFGIGPFIKYYMFTSNENFAITFQALARYNMGKIEPEDSAPGQKRNSYYFALSPGFTYFFNDKWGLDFQLAGISYTINIPDKENPNIVHKVFVFGVQSFSPSLGFRYYLGR